jgi:predicted metalloprotease
LVPLVPDIHARRRLIVPGAARGSSLAARVSSPSRPSAFCSGSIPWTYWCHSRTAPRPPRPRRAHRLRLRPGRPPVTRSRSSSSVILGDTEDTWKTLFGQMGGEYHPPRLVLFRGAVDSACGLASSAVGPFYCSADSHVYLDRSFFEALAQRFGAPGEFARAYVIAHEIGHHVQKQLGITEKVGQQRARAGETRSNAVSVRIELQADCFAGIWGHFAR